jgi:hypothetical protein
MKALERMPVRSSSIAEHDGQHEAAHATRQADDAGDGADVVWVVIADVLEHRCLAEGPSHTQHTHHSSEGVNVQTNVEGLWAIDGLNGEISLGIAEDEQADPARPHHPPGHLVGAMLVGQVATNRTQHATGQ